ncbi:MoaF C-terminal domain-containing protein [Vogesella facilis]|uniref:MoaF C-terminal domain-containing protein n=1 Tax=Vogesella facilis TaxID=1655232 RepID=A0ABV7RI18_9NEIS
MQQQPVFIQVGALADGFAPDNNTLPPCGDLAGRSFRLYDSAGGVATLQLAADGSLTLQQDTGDSHAPCRITSLRDGLYFVDCLPPSPAGASLSLVLDLAHGLYTRVDGQLPDEAATRLDPFRRVAQGLELTAVAASISHGTVDRAARPGEQLHHATRELVGMRNQYRYSRTECYEHVYLNENFYAWQCLQGVEQGLADVDRCHYIKLAAQLYLFVWREKIIPTLGVVLIDLARGKTDGKIVGYQGGDFGVLSNFAVGATAQVLNTTRHALD